MTINEPEEAAKAAEEEARFTKIFYEALDAMKEVYSIYPKEKSLRDAWDRARVNLDEIPFLVGANNIDDIRTYIFWTVADFIRLLVRIDRRDFHGDQPPP